jgi:predicted transcriptional regulator
VLKQLGGLDFLSRHKEYFKSHSLVHLPEKLVLRLGDIAEATYLSSISQSLYSVERLIKEAESYIWLVNDQISFSVFCELGRALERGTKNRVIQTKGFTYPSDIVRDYFQYYERNILPIDRRSRATGALEDRLDDRAEIFLFISEKQAAVAFPLNSGKFDYLVFSGSDKRFHNWCSEAFNYCWTKAQPLEIVTEKPCEWIMDNPEALSGLERIIAGQKLTLRKNLASELEKLQLTRSGSITRLGYLVRSRLDEHRSPEANTVQSS